MRKELDVAATLTLLDGTLLPFFDHLGIKCSSGIFVTINCIITLKRVTISSGHTTSK
jgi:hypothetical protein